MRTDSINEDANINININTSININDSDNVDALKNRGNESLRRGELNTALECYSSALKLLSINDSQIGHDDDDVTFNKDDGLLIVVLLSNRAMCRLKQHEASSTSSSCSHSDFLADCISDCTLALKHLEHVSSSSSSTSSTTTSSTSLRSKLLYRRAKASSKTNPNSAARDLLALLSHSPSQEASDLLRSIRQQHQQQSHSPTITALSSLPSSLPALKCLAVDHPMEIGSNKGIPALLQIVQQSTDADHARDSLSILSHCLSHPGFLDRYSNQIDIPTLVSLGPSANRLLRMVLVHDDNVKDLQFLQGTPFPPDSNASHIRRAIASSLPTDHWHDTLDLLSAWTSPQPDMPTLTREQENAMKPRDLASHRTLHGELRSARRLRVGHRISQLSEDGLDSIMECAVRMEDRRREVTVVMGRMMGVLEEEEGKKLLAKYLGEGASVMDHLESEEQLQSLMKRGLLITSLLLGHSTLGTWALQNFTSHLPILLSSDDPRAASIVSELVSSAASVESARSLLSPSLSHGALEDLLAHPDARVRSGGAACLAKIGLASGALGGEVEELLEVAVTLLDDADPATLERGIEVLAYLGSKTRVKNLIAGGFQGSEATNTTLQRLVEIGGSPHPTTVAYGIASIFQLLSVSVETLQREASAGKDITKEQYDQLQALGKTREEKDSEEGREEKDTPMATSERIRRLAGANVPRAMVKILEGENTSDAAQHEILVGMGRMASEQSVRGSLIQQGCLTACLRLDKGDKPNESEKKIIRLARSCIAKLLVTTNPTILTASQRSGSIKPLLQLVKDPDAPDLMQFEALLSLTNLGSHSDETKNQIVAHRGIPTLSYAMFSDHEMVRRAATEALSNLIPHPEMISHLRRDDTLQLWVSFALDHEEQFHLAKAAAGGLAMAVSSPEVAISLSRSSLLFELVRSLVTSGRVELMHRVLAMVVGMMENGCREAVVGTGVGAFCGVMLEEYQEGRLVEPGMEDVVGLAKEVVALLR